MARKTLVFAAAAVCAVGLTLARPQARQAAAQAPAQVSRSYTALDPSNTKPEGWATKDYLYNTLGWDQNKPLWNAAKQKLLDGKQVFSFTAGTPDTDFYCQRAPHYDFVWIDMQHSQMTWGDVAKLIDACPHAGAIPMVRLPDELESTLQHATDVGAMGMIEPTVDTVEKAEAVARFSRYPPYGRRSQGSARGQTLWGLNGVNYRQEVNANMLVAIMCETPTCAANIYDIARVPGIDLVIAANSDMNNFSGFVDGSPEYEALFTLVHDGVLKAGKYLGATSAAYATGGPSKRGDVADWRFFQNGPSKDGFQPPAAPGRGGAPNAPAPGGRGAAPSGR
jgi:2-keto-3-deoxy-L-rhamnonate aldolase RhmA